MSDDKPGRIEIFVPADDPRSGSSLVPMLVIGLALAVIGIAVGLAVALSIMRLMSSLLFDVSPIDPLTYVLVSAALIAATLLASYVPALRATTVDPINALRAE